MKSENAIVLFNAATKDKAKSIRKQLLEKKMIRGGFIVEVEPGFFDELDNMVEEDKFFVVFCHTSQNLCLETIKEIENISDSKAMSWKLDECSQNYAEWVNKISKNL